MGSNPTARRFFHGLPGRMEAMNEHGQTSMAIQIFWTIVLLIVLLLILKWFGIIPPQ